MTKAAKRWVLLAALVVFGMALTAGGYFTAVKNAWIPYNEYDIRSIGSLSVGDLAPDLELESADGTGPRKLSDLYREKPLVLVFGSYT